MDIPERLLLQLLVTVGGPIDRLRTHGSFIEAGGDKVPSRGACTFNYYISIPSAETWALNLALLTRASTLVRVPPPPGLARRLLFKPNTKLEELTAALVAGVTTAIAAASWLLTDLGPARLMVSTAQKFAPKVR